MNSNKKRTNAVQLMSLLSAYTQNSIIAGSEAQNAIKAYMGGNNDEIKKIILLEVPSFMATTRNQLKNYVQ